MFRPLVVALALLFGAGTAHAAPVEILPLAWTSSGLQEEGGNRLKADIAAARFVALGEDHGFAGAPQLGVALAAEMRRLGPVAHAVETGPHTTGVIARTLEQGGLEAFDRLLDGRPLALPFLSNVEDAALALAIIRAGGTTSLWGIDQEFIASPLILMDILAGKAPTAAVRQKVEAIRQQDIGHAAAGAFGSLYLSKASPQDFAQLRRDFVGQGDALAIIDALSKSAVVYQYNNAGRYLENNEARAALMRECLLDALFGWPAAQGRVLFKMGAYHLGRGTSPTGIYDLGSLLPGLAAARRQTSLHIAYLPIGGQVRKLKPGGATATAVEPYADETVAPLLALADIPADAVAPTGHVLIPLTALRHRIARAGKMKELSSFQRFLLIGYDYLVTTRDAQPATHFEAWPG